jgi:hypothetical protein
MDSVISWAILTIFGIIGAGCFVWKINDELSAKQTKEETDYWK